MKTTHIVMIGAGSYVFSIGFLYDLLVGNGTTSLHLTLVDSNEEMAERVAAIGRIIAQQASVPVEIHATTNREQTLHHADFVTCSAAVQLHQRYQMDRDIIAKHGIREITSECGGVGGLSYALRSIDLVMGIAKDMENYCPDAWLFDVSNPLSRVVTAVSRHTKIKVAGFCNVSQGGMNGGYENIATILNRDHRDLDVVSAGLNHFNWLLSVRDKKSGEDLLPLVHHELENKKTMFGPLSLKLWRETGYLPLAGDSHTGEFVPYDASVSQGLNAGHHGNPKEREQRIELMQAVIAGKNDWHELLERRAWERPGLTIRALADNTLVNLDMINVVNDGYIEILPAGAVVEVPATVENGVITGKRIGSLPDGVAHVCSRVSQVHTVVADAAVTGDRSLIEEAINLDPAIVDKQVGLAAVQELIITHRDVLPKFA